MEGEILTCKYKSKLAADILKCFQPEQVINVESSDEPNYIAIIFDGIVVVKKVDIKKLNVSNCSEYAADYVKIGVFESRGLATVKNG